MSERVEIEALLDQVQKLRDQIRPADRDVEFVAMERRMEDAVRDAERAREERDEAVAELEKLKHDVAWTMEKLLVKDFLFFRGQKFPCCDEGWLPLHLDPKDTERIEWINANGRIGASDEHWLISVPHHLDLESASLPQPYNIRHILDLCGAVKKEQSQRNEP